MSSKRRPLAMEAEEVWLRVAYTGNTTGPPPLPAPSVCWLQVTGQGHGVMSLLIFNMTCFTDNKLVVHSQMRNRGTLDCDPTAWVAPGQELVMTSNFVNISIEVNNVHAPFNLHAQFKAFPVTRKKLLDTRRVNQYLGLSRVGYNGESVVKV